jgi:beta-glucosidase
VADGEVPGAATSGRVGDVEALVDGLTLEEKAGLTAGADTWSTAAIERVGIPSVRVTDGPNGARGPVLPPGFGGRPTAMASVCVPCGAALGATWDPALVERVGALLGDEARAKGCRVLLAPTVNLHRSPLGGRNFESYSEDPLLAGRLAAAFVRGVQARGVATTVKHFAGNESEFERMTMDSVIDGRALHELYLLPFELAVREGGALGVMTSYNRLNGSYCADDAELLGEILRGRWGFEGFVLTDWFALGDTAAAARAGLDLQMPGPARFYGQALVEAVRSGRVDEGLVDAAARRLLRVFDHIGALDEPAPEPVVSEDRPEHRALAREAATAAAVLLKNDGVLPLDAAALRTLAVIGPNAARAEIMGGGSARLQAQYEQTPLDELRRRLGEPVGIIHEPGVQTGQEIRPLTGGQLRTAAGSPGLELEVFEGHALAGPVVERSHREAAELLFFGAPAPVTGEEFSVRARATLTPEATGACTFRLVQAGRARLLLDGVTVLDGFAQPPPPGPEIFGTASLPLAATVSLEAGRPVELVIEFANTGAGRISGVKVGGSPAPPEDLMDRAVAAAAGADVAVVVVGTGAEWESEGFDRTSMDLPGAQDELIERVLAANPNTVVVLNTGSPVTMPWADRVPAIVQVWFGGQEMAGGLVDVLLGDAEPGGRLPTTFPERLEHNPTHGNFPGENGRVRYGEGLLVGYRWYDAHRLPTRFAFGHGLSYTTFALGPPRISSATVEPGRPVVVEVPVTNTGTRRGCEVVQCYVAPPPSRLSRPPKELKAFAKLWLDPGETGTARLELTDRAFAYWDPGDPDAAALGARLAESVVWARPLSGRRAAAWVIDPGVYHLQIGRSSADTAVTASVVVPEAVTLG